VVFCTCGLLSGVGIFGGLLFGGFLSGGLLSGIPGRNYTFWRNIQLLLERESIHDPGYGSIRALCLPSSKLHAVRRLYAYVLAPHSKKP